MATQKLNFNSENKPHVVKKSCWHFIFSGAFEWRVETGYNTDFENFGKELRMQVGSCVGFSELGNWHNMSQILPLLQFTFKVFITKTVDL